MSDRTLNCYSWGGNPLWLTRCLHALLTDDMANTACYVQTHCTWCTLSAGLFHTAANLFSFSDLLGVTPAPNNGTEGVLFDVLRTPPTVHPVQLGTTHPCGNETGSLAVLQNQQGACSCSWAVAKVTISVLACHAPHPSCFVCLVPVSGCFLALRCGMCFQTDSGWWSPLGNLVAMPAGPSLCESRQSDHAVAYDHLMMAPAWIAFTVNLVWGGGGSCEL